MHLLRPQTRKLDTLRTEIQETNNITQPLSHRTARTIPLGISAALALQRVEFSLVLSKCNLQFCFNHFSYNAISSVSTTSPLSDTHTHTHTHTQNMRARAYLTEFKTKTLHHTRITSAKSAQKGLNTIYFQEIFPIFNNKTGIWISLKLFAISAYPKLEDEIKWMYYFVLTLQTPN